MTAHYPPVTVEHIDLSDTEFWGWPMAGRQAAFAMLRSLDHPPFYEEPEKFVRTLETFLATREPTAAR